MGLFTKKQKLKDLTPKEVKNARSYLDQLINMYAPGQSPQFPVRQMEGLSPNEQIAQDRLGNIIDTGGEGYQMALDYNRGVLNNQYDPRTSDFYQGYRQEAQDLLGASNADIRRQAQKGGGTSRTTPTYALQAENTQDTNSKILQLLGSMYENERNRKTGAAESSAQLSRDRVNQLVGTQGLAAQPRSIEQQRNDAAYEAALQAMLFPYTQQLRAIQALFETPNTYVQTGGGMTDLGFAVNAGASAVGSYFGS